MSESSFRMRATVRSSDLPGIRTVLEEMFGKDAVIVSAERSDELIIEAELKGESMKSLNRSLLSTLRKVEKRTTVRAEWTGQSRSERYFDYVLKKSENQ